MGFLCLCSTTKPIILIAIKKEERQKHSDPEHLQILEPAPTAEEGGADLPEAWLPASLFTHWGWITQQCFW